MDYDYDYAQAAMWLRPNVPLDSRLEVLRDLAGRPHPGDNLIKLVVPLLLDHEAPIRHAAHQMVQLWGGRAVPVLVSQLRAASSSSTRVRKALIIQLSLIGAHAQEAVPFLKSLTEDPHVGDEARRAVAAIQYDPAGLLSTVLFFLLELAIIALAVAGPVLIYREVMERPLARLRLEPPPQSTMYLALGITIAALFVVRLLYTSLFSGPKSKTVSPTVSRWTAVVVVTIFGLLISAGLGYYFSGHYESQKPTIPRGPR